MIINCLSIVKKSWSSKKTKPRKKIFVNIFFRIKFFSAKYFLDLASYYKI